MAAGTSVDDCGGSITRARRANVRFTPKSGQTQAAGFVRFVPKADICNAAKGPLFDHPIGASQHTLGDRQANIVCRVLVDDQFETGGLLDR